MITLEVFMTTKEKYMNESILKSNNELRIAICEDNPEHLSINHEFLLRNAGRMEPLFYLYTSGSSLLEDVEAGKNLMFYSVTLKCRISMESKLEMPCAGTMKI